MNKVPLKAFPEIPIQDQFLSIDQLIPVVNMFLSLQIISELKEKIFQSLLRKAKFS